jgi:hypothetical protein
LIGNSVVNEIGVFTEVNNALTSENVQVLGDVCVGGLHLLPNVSNRHLFFLKQAENFEPDRVGHRLEQFGYDLDLFIFHVFFQVFLHDGSLLAWFPSGNGPFSRYLVVLEILTSDALLPAAEFLARHYLEAKVLVSQGKLSQLFQRLI